MHQRQREVYDVNFALRHDRRLPSSRRSFVVSKAWLLTKPLSFFPGCTRGTCFLNAGARSDFQKGRLEPTDVAVSGKSLIAKLTRSETAGEDRGLALRMVVVSSCCCYQLRDWVSTGWKLLNFHADFSRDCLMPTPPNNCSTCKKAELRCGVFASKNSVSQLSHRWRCMSLHV